MPNMMLRRHLPMLALAVMGVAHFSQSWAVSPTAVPAAPSRAPSQSLVITYDMSDLPLTISVDKSGIALVEDLPFPGEVIYQPATGTLFYRHPEEDGWLSISPENLSPVVVSAKLVSKGAGQPWQGKPTGMWEVKAGSTTCDQWQGSPSAAARTGLNVADILHILTVVQWLNGGTPPNVCEKIGITAAEGASVGLPVLFTGPNGRWQLQEIAATHVPKIEVPKATPVTDETRLRLLLVQFSPEERAAMLAQYGRLPVQGQIDAISQLLNNESVP